MYDHLPQHAERAEMALVEMLKAVSLQEWLWGAQIVGIVFTGVSATVAALTYVRSQLQRLADGVRAIILQCHQEFGNLSNEGDVQGVRRLIREIVAHPRMHAVIEACWNARNDDIAAITQLIELYKYDIDFAISESIARADEARGKPYDEGFQSAVYSLQPTYPILHAFMFIMHYFMRSYMGYMRWPDKYAWMIKHCLVKMHETGDMQQALSLDTLASLMYGCIRTNLNGSLIRDEVAEFFGDLSRMMILFITPYRQQSDFDLWRRSGTERKLNRELIFDIGDPIGTLKTLIGANRKFLGRYYDETAEIANRVEGRMRRMPHEDDGSGEQSSGSAHVDDTSQPDDKPEL
jgi:hypothetical protein